MIVGVARAEFHLPDSRSLKEKRRFLQSVTQRLHQRLRVSTAETDFHDLHQRAEVGIALVHSNRHEAARKLEEIHRLLDEATDAYLVAWDADCLEDTP